MYHHGLINILVEFHLQSIGDNWESFLVRNHFEERSPKQARSSRSLKGRKRTIEGVKEHEPKTQLELLEEEFPIVDILQRMKKGNLKRKKVSKREKEIPKTRILPQEEKSETKRKKVQGLPTSGLRRSTRLSTVQQTILKATKYIDLEGNEPTENLESPPKGSLESSPRVSTPPCSSSLTSPMHSLIIDPIQQEIYDYIESLERKEIATKETIQSPGERSN